MRIKRVEIIGFKSFCDRAVINLDAQVTAVVGPNGCGKSNIVDAIRWCMGEQSAKHLRGKAMEDVIFNGSETRGPAPMAEVSLTFDDVGFSAETLTHARDAAPDGDEMEDLLEDELGEADGALPSDSEPVEVEIHAEALPTAEPLPEAQSLDFASFTEVTITRRLFRDGTSQYYINKTACRLRDITDFFLGTGVGTKAYAIIEQGRIGQIVSARPQDRRLIIEEAAGITKFKSKKKAAEKKLEQTRQNLLRVTDIVAELEKRMGSLRRQAQKAERYRKYKGELREIDLRKSVHRYLELLTESNLLASRLTEVRAELQASREGWGSRDEQMVAERETLGELERRLVGMQESVYELDNRIRLSESKMGFERREADELEARSRAALAERETLAAELEQASREAHERERERLELEQTTELDDDSLLEREAAVGEARQMLINSQRVYDEAKLEQAALGAKLAGLEAQVDGSSRRHQEASLRVARLEQELADGRQRLTTAEREAKVVEETLGSVRQAKLDLGTQREMLEARLAELKEASVFAERVVDDLRQTEQRKASRLLSLEELAARHEGLARGTQALMQPGATLPEGLAPAGIVADLLRVPPAYELAVESLLGELVGGVVVVDGEHAALGIAYLKQNGAGRSAFVPLAMAPSEMLCVPAGAGVRGALASFIEVVDGYAALRDALFGHILLVDDLDCALAVKQAGFVGGLVTLDGDVVTPQGVVTGGTRESAGSCVLAQKREVRELQDALATLRVEAATAAAELARVRQETGQVQRALDGLRANAHESELAVMGHEKDLLRLRAEMDRMRDRANYLGKECAELGALLAEADSQNQDLQAQLAAVQQAREALTGSLAERAELVDTHRTSLEDLQASLTSAKVLAAQVGEKKAALDAAVMRLQNHRESLVARMQRLYQEGTEGGARVEVLRESCAAISDELEQLRARRLDDAAALEQGRADYETRRHALIEEEHQTRQLRNTLDRLTAEHSQLELRAGQNAMNVQVLDASVAERYQLELVDILYDFHDKPLVGEAEDARIAELRDLLDRMGTDINLTAIDEFNEVSTRFEFLSSQRDDLDRAVDQLQKAIDKINKASRRLFKETYQAVNAKFKDVFPRLFRGGQAALSLTGGEDVDLLEAGIEIMAQPPGKKNSTVEQLSGGEKALTAVALVFSIFLIKPSPFCILDEVDAPLDEANVDRYNEIVREMTERSQFIVITHNKRTMESADNLYGVTMQEAGVSKLVTVNLSRMGLKASAA